MKINTRSAFIAAVIGLLGLVAGGCGGGGGANAPGPSVSSGIQGHAQITTHAGPSLPGQPTPTPHDYAGTILVVEPSGGGSEIARATTDTQGNFSVTVSPGAYLLVPALTPAEQNSAITGQTQMVTVTEGQITAVTVSYSQSLP